MGVLINSYFLNILPVYFLISFFLLLYAAALRSIFGILQRTFSRNPFRVCE